MNERTTDLSTYSSNLRHIDMSAVNMPADRNVKHTYHTCQSSECQCSNEHLEHTHSYPTYNDE